MDYLRQSVGLRGYAQKNPKQEYKREAYDLFMRMLEEYKSDVVTLLSRVRVQDQAAVEAAQRQQEKQQEQAAAFEYRHADADSAYDQAEEEALAAAGGAGSAVATAARPKAAAEDAEPEQPFVRDGRKVGRNEPCPCGSGKKYKQCHGKL